MGRVLMFEVGDAVKYGLDCAVILQLIKQSMEGEDARKTGWCECGMNFILSYCPFFDGRKVEELLRWLTQNKIISARMNYCEERKREVLQYRINGEEDGR